MTVAMTPVQVPKDAVSLGKGPIPETDAELKQRIIEAIEKDLAENGATLPVPIAERVAAAFGEQPNISSVTVDFSNVTLAVQDEASEQQPDLGPAVKKKVEAELSHVAVRANPARLESMPVSASFELENLAVDWLTDANGDVWLAVSERKLEGFSGQGELQADIDDARALARELAERAAKDDSVRIKEVDFDIEVERPRGGEQRIRATGVLDGGYKFIGAQVKAEVDAVLENSTGKARVEDFKLRSSNPLVKLMLLVFRKQIRARLSEPIDLNSGLPKGYRIDHLELRTRGRALIATLRLG
ncbi:hypothetical protein [Gulosibacter chungangensis]|uniref:Uncharacterized protein n=1 Tax=Gulosibacter chungangensis TaxID=979746 RepID=A0A7J5BHV6_9MICO|nr:hypothetical protein [Gulosibacter chungangensis]KAB1645019.1 hypothetical protein F8O05_01825 [Gulosibacter chungangensis]